MDDPSPVANICPECARRKLEYRPPRPRAEVIHEICEEWGVSKDALLGPCRLRYLAHARQALMAAMRHAGYSYPKIGAILNRDHTTVIYGVRAHERRQGVGE